MAGNEVDLDDKLDDLAPADPTNPTVTLPAMTPADAQAAFGTAVTTADIGFNTANSSAEDARITAVTGVRDTLVAGVATNDSDWDAVMTGAGNAFGAAIDGIQDFDWQNVRDFVGTISNARKTAELGALSAQSSFLSSYYAGLNSYTSTLATASVGHSTAKAQATADYYVNQADAEADLAEANNDPLAPTLRTKANAFAAFATTYVGYMTTAAQKAATNAVTESANKNAESLATVTTQVTTSSGEINSFYAQKITDAATPPPVDNDANNDGIPDAPRPTATESIAVYMAGERSQQASDRTGVHSSFSDLVDRRAPVTRSTMEYSSEEIPTVIRLGEQASRTPQYTSEDDPSLMMLLSGYPQQIIALQDGIAFLSEAYMNGTPVAGMSLSEMQQRISSMAEQLKALRSAAAAFEAEGEKLCDEAREKNQRESLEREQYLEEHQDSFADRFRKYTQAPITAGLDGFNDAFQDSALRHPIDSLGQAGKSIAASADAARHLSRIMALPSEIRSRLLQGEFEGMERYLPWNTLEWFKKTYHETIPALKKILPDIIVAINQTMEGIHDATLSQKAEIAAYVWGYALFLAIETAATVGIADKLKGTAFLSKLKGRIFTNLRKWIPPKAGGMMDRLWRSKLEELREQYKKATGRDYIREPEQIYSNGSPIAGAMNPATGDIRLGPDADDVTEFEELLHWEDSLKHTREWWRSRTAEEFATEYRKGEKTIEGLMDRYGFDSSVH